MTARLNEPAWLSEDDLAKDDFSFGLDDPLSDTPPPPVDDDFEWGDLDAPVDITAPAVATPSAATSWSPDFGSGASGAEQPVPRITIHAFCERREIAAMIQSAANDRRLAKTTVTVEIGGVDLAVTRLSEQATPNLILFDSALPPARLLESLDRLAEVVDADSKVVVLGAANDIALYRELMKRGVSEYIVPPIEPVQLIRTISTLYANPDQPFVGRVVAVMGARGGVGASTIAHNVAWSLAERYQANTTLVDLDLSFGTTGLDFNQDAAVGVSDALLRADQIDEVYLDRLLVRHSERLALLAAPATLEREYDVDPVNFELLIDRVRRTAPFVVLDLPHVWSGWVRQTILSCDDLMIVTSPDLAGLRNAKNLVDLVRASRPHDPPPAVILNMVGVPKRPEIPHKDFSEALGLTPFVSIPFDPAIFGASANNGQPVLEVAAASKPGLAMDTIVRTLCGRDPAPRKKASLLDRLPVLLKK